MKKSKKGQKKAGWARVGDKDTEYLMLKALFFSGILPSSTVCGVLGRAHFLVLRLPEMSEAPV